MGKALSERADVPTRRANTASQVLSAAPTTTSGRHARAVRRARREGRKGHRPVFPAPLPPGSSAASSTRSSATCRPTSTFTSSSTMPAPTRPAHPRLVRQTTALAHPLHPDLGLLDQPGRALLRAAHRKANPPRRPSIDQALEADIYAYIDAHNAEPKPFRWTKSADDILLQ